LRHQQRTPGCLLAASPCICKALARPSAKYAAAHEYHRRSEAADLDEYYALIKCIQHEGVNKMWRGHKFKYLDLSDGYSYRGWGAVVNRVRTDTL
jgi:hypothetical protein